MSTKKNTAFELAHGDVSTAVSKFFQELGEEGKSVVKKMKTDPAFVRRLANFAKDGGVIPVGSQLAEGIFSVWKIITLGTHRSTGALERAFQEATIYHSQEVRYILQRPGFSLSSTKRNIELVQVTVADLGFSDGASRIEVYDAALAAGLSLCPLEVGLQLRRQYLDQPENEWLFIGSKPMLNIAHEQCIFVVIHDYRLRLEFYPAAPSVESRANYRWVFCRGKK